MELSSHLHTLLLLSGVLTLLMYLDPPRTERKSARTVVLDGAKVLVFSQLIVLVLLLIMGDNGNGLLTASLYCDLMGLGGYAALGAARHLAARRQWPFFLSQTAEFAATVLGICAGAMLANTALHVLIGESFLLDFSGFLGHLNLVLIGAIVGVAVLVASLRAFYNVKLYAEREAHRQQAFEVLQLREQHVSAKLERIQAQINPHFLYNALNGIAALVHDDPHRAEQMTLALARLFRAALDTQHEHRTTVRQEVDLVRTYLDIESARFGDRLFSTIHVDPAALDAPIPRFLLQPLVENAIKHGASKQDGRGEIALDIRQREDELHIAVKDNGPDFPVHLVGGHGWRSVSERLELLYPGRYALDLRNGADKQVHITLRNAP